MIGRRYVLPRAVAAALERVFEVPADGVIVIERSRYAKLHRGMSATTRPNRILLAMSGSEFVARPELLLHEYFHAATNPDLEEHPVIEESEMSETRRKSVEEAQADQFPRWRPTLLA